MILSSRKVELFADKIPHTHGAPVRATVGRQAM